MNLSYFLTDENSLFQAGQAFFENKLQLGLNASSGQPIADVRRFLRGYADTTKAFDLVGKTFFLGKLTSEMLAANSGRLQGEADLRPRLSLDEAVPEATPTGKYAGLMVFGLELLDRPSRAQVTELARAFNRASQHLPVVVLLRYPALAGGAPAYLALASTERTPYVQVWRAGEKVTKVSVLFDILLAKPHSGHLRILQDLRIGAEVKTLEDLYRQWNRVLSIEVLNDAFFRELRDWYFWAVKECEFPSDLEPNREVRNAEAVIRLITRVMFAWFLKEKHYQRPDGSEAALVPPSLFDEGVYKANIKVDKDATGSAYYRAILQNLFFTTLNTEREEDFVIEPSHPFKKSRMFKPNTNGWPDKYRGEKTFYRYEKLFSDPAAGLKLFGEVPFLNGGLFECLDARTGEGSKSRIEQAVDCFTTEVRFHDKLRVPDYLFFGALRQVDLSDFYDAEDKARHRQDKVRGLFHLLNAYKFTIEENTPLVEEIALDPELLGRIFESLLATYNPETKQTARKKTGSFYTPREIVAYMCDESLLRVLMRALPDAPDAEERLRKLLDYVSIAPAHSPQTPSATPDAASLFSQDETRSLINAVAQIRILDPACGSGAFPMGLLHRLTHVLQRLDPSNYFWREKLSNQIQAKLHGAFLIPDAEERKRLLQELNEVFERHTGTDYGRKLYLIERTLYGVDLQPVAVQITKLRFFISLVVEQTPNPELPNLGIKALPNLETKFVAANSLLRLHRPVQIGLQDLRVEKLREELFDVRRRHFTARLYEKRNLRRRDEELRQHLGTLLKANNWLPHEADQVTAWNPYSQLGSASFFDPEWMFGLPIDPNQNQGFNLIIGNPPYVRADSQEPTFRETMKAERFYETLHEKWDLYVPFLELSYKLLCPGGITTMIISDAYCHAKYALRSQEWFREKATIPRIDFLGELEVFNAAVHSVIPFFERCAPNAENNPLRRRHVTSFGDVQLLRTGPQPELASRAIFFAEDAVNATTEVETVPLSSLCYISKGMVVNADEKLAKGAFRLEDLISENSDAKHTMRFAEGKHLSRWLPTTHRWLEWGTTRVPALLSRPGFEEFFSPKEKLITMRSPGLNPRTCYDDNQLRFNESAIGFVLWYSLRNIKNKSLKSVARYKGEKPPRPDLPQREYLEDTSRIFSVKYLMGVMNSAWAKQFLHFNRRSNIHLYPDDWKKLPIPLVSQEQQAPIISLVDQLLAAKQNGEALDKLETELDGMVNVLFGQAAPGPMVAEMAVVEDASQKQPAKAAATAETEND
jgi:adenine-specific DNA-methyltransferase